MIKNLQIIEVIDSTEELLKKAVQENLSIENQVKVEQPFAIETYTLSHSRGSLLVTPGGGKFKKSDLPHTIIQDHDIQLDIYPVIRNISNQMKPWGYIDFIYDTLVGTEIESRRTERQIYAAGWEAVKEENGIWWFRVSIIIPTERAEKNLLNNQ